MREGGAWKHRNGCDTRPCIKRIGNRYGIGFRKLDVVRSDIGLAKQDPFPVRGDVKAERFLFLEFGEGRGQDEAKGKSDDPEGADPFLQLPFLRSRR